MTRTKRKDSVIIEIHEIIMRKKKKLANINIRNNEKQKFNNKLINFFFGSHIS